MDCLRKVIAEGLSQAINKGLISIKVPEGSGYADECGRVNVVIGGRQSVLIWKSMGHGELRVTVWWDYDHDKNPAGCRERFSTGGPLAKSSRYPEFVGAMASACLERKTGCYIQGWGRDGIIDTYLRRGAKEVIDRMLVAQPTAFFCEGECWL